MKSISIHARIACPGTALLCALLCLVLFALPARAVLIQLSATGIVTAVTADPFLPGQFSIGQSMAATFVYDTASAPLPSLILTRSTYLNAAGPGSFTVGTYSGTTGGGNVNMADNDPTFNDRFRLAGGPVSAPSIGIRDPLAFLITLEDAAQAALTNTDLPIALPALTDFSERSWALTFTPIMLAPAEPNQVQGRLLTLTLTTIPSRLPVTSTLLLIVAGALLMCVFLRSARSARHRTQGATAPVPTAA